MTRTQIVKPGLGAAGREAEGEKARERNYELNSGICRFLLFACPSVLFLQLVTTCPCGVFFVSLFLFKGQFISFFEYLASRNKYPHNENAFVLVPIIISADLIRSIY